MVRAGGLYLINVHPSANRDGDWSPASRYRPLQHAQLSALAALAREIPGPVAMCGDFNIARDSELFDGFMAGTGLADAFSGSCPPTFRPEYLEHGRQPRCIDFILTSGPVKAEHASVMFTGQPEPGGEPVSDHLGLQAVLYTGWQARSPYGSAARAPAVPSATGNAGLPRRPAQAAGPAVPPTSFSRR